MLCRSLKIKNDPRNFFFPKIDALFSANEQMRKLETLTKILLNLESVTKALHNDNVTRT